VLGFAFDGFPITGDKISSGRYLTTRDLDECHGIESDIIVDGKHVTTYHYVMTEDFPYSVSCFRGTSSVKGPTGGAPSGASSQQQQRGQTQGGQGGTPPQEALNACSGKTNGASCSFVTPMGDTLSGTCGTPQGSALACMPAH
jgi:hypothetical protein